MGFEWDQSALVVTEFTFFLGIPVMFGASGWKILKFIIKGNTLDLGSSFLLVQWALGVLGVSLYVIRFLTDYVKKHDFTIFGKYRIGLGVLLIVYGIFKSYFLYSNSTVFVAIFIGKRK